MANIVLPQAAILSNTASEMKPVVESGGTLYRTSSSTLMANMVNNLAEERKTSFSGLKFIVDDNNIIKKITLDEIQNNNGVTTVFLSGSFDIFPMGESRQIFLIADKSYSEVIDLITSGNEVIFVYPVDDNNAVIYRPTVLTSTMGIIISTTAAVEAFGIRNMTQTIAWDGTNFYVETSFLEDELTDITFTQGDPITCNYTYQDLEWASQAGFKIKEITMHWSGGKIEKYPCYSIPKDGGFLGISIDYPEKGGNYPYQPYINHGDLVYNQSGIEMKSTYTNSAPWKTILWQAPEGYEGEEVEINCDLSGYQAIEITGFLSFTDEEGNWTIGPKVEFNIDFIELMGVDSIRCSVTDGWDWDQYWQRDFYISRGGIYIGAGYFGGNDYEEYNATWILRPGPIYGLNYD